MKNFRTRPVKQKSWSEMTPKGLVLHSLKIYSDKLQREDKATVPTNLLAKIKKLKAGDVKAARQMLKPVAVALHITSKDVKANLANHEREWSHCYRPTVRAVGRQDILEKLYYGGEDKKTKTKKPARVKKNNKK
jgi:hypothetical protein